MLDEGRDHDVFDAITCHINNDRRAVNTRLHLVYAPSVPAMLYRVIQANRNLTSVAHC